MQKKDITSMDINWVTIVRNFQVIKIRLTRNETIVHAVKCRLQKHVTKSITSDYTWRKKIVK